MYYMKLAVFETVSQHFVQMTVVSMLTGILFGIVSHVASRHLPPKLTSHRADTGQCCLDIGLVIVAGNTSVTAVKIVGSILCVISC